MISKYSCILPTQSILVENVNKNSVVDIIVAPILPKTPLGIVRLAHSSMFFNDDKSINEFDFLQNSVRQALADEIIAPLENGLVTRSLRFAREV